MLEILTRVELRKSANAHLMQARFGDFADAGHLPHWKPGKHPDFVTWMNEENAVGLCQIRGDLGHNPSTADSDGAIQIQLSANRVVQAVSCLKRRTEQTRSAGHVEIGLIDRRHLYFR